MDAGSYHVELFVGDKMVTVFVSDSAEKAAAIAGFKGMAILTADGKAQRIALEPQEGARFGNTSGDAAR